MTKEVKEVCKKCGYYTGNPKHSYYKCYTNSCPAKGDRKHTESIDGGRNKGRVR